MGEKVVIMGGGLGGLSAGAALAQSGFSVTLLEEQPRLGGYAIAFRRGDFVFDVALHVAPGGAAGTLFHDTISRLGLNETVTFIGLKQGFKVLLGHRIFEMPNRMEELLEYLSVEFPDERDGIQRFRKDLARHAPIYSDVLNGKAGIFRIVTGFIPKLPAFLKHAGCSTEDYLNRFFKGKTIKTLLYQAAVFFGIPMTEFPAVNFLLMFYLLYTEGMFTIQGGGQALSQALESRIMELGGRIITGSRVSRVRVDKQRAVAVLTSDGTEYPADYVVSNINTPALIRELIGESHFPASYLSALKSLRPSLSVAQLHVGLDCPAGNVGISHHITTAFPDEDIDACLNQQRTSMWLKGYSILCHGMTEPHDTGGNDSVIKIIGGVASDPWLSLGASPDKDRYKEAKEKCMERVLSLVGQAFPLIPDHCKILDLATPWTFKRYTGNPSGAILGFDCTMGMHRTLIKVSRLPIKNLFLANAWTKNLGGFMPSMRAGLSAADKIIGS